MDTENLSRPMKWNEFQSMPKEQQKQYIESLAHEYKIGLAALSRMFGVKSSYCGEELNGLGVSLTRRAAREDTERFMNEFVNSEQKTTLDKISLTFSGEFSVEMIEERIAGLFPDGQAVTVTVRIVAR